MFQSDLLESWRLERGGAGPELDNNSITIFFRTFYHFMTLKHMTGSTADTYLEYIQRNLPEGVSMKIIRHEVKKLYPSIAKAPHEQQESQ